MKYSKTQKDLIESQINNTDLESLPNHIEQNIDTINILKSKSDQGVARYQRLIEKTADFFERPVFFFSLFGVIAVWIAFNLLAPSWNMPRFDPPPFGWLEKSITLGSLLMTTGILVRQSRQEYLAEQQKQLSLQLNLITEQKVAKLIALIEELRKDLPNVNDRYDLEAEIMQQSIDPHKVVDALEERLIHDISEVQISSPETE
jgi:uncharacterized membrane protein